MPRPNVAGIDFGSSCTKFVWQRDPDHYGNAGLDRLIFSSTADKTIEEIVVDLQKSNVTMAVATGINIDNETNLNKLLGWRTTIVRPTGDHIDSEISLQAHGAIELLNQVGPSKFRNFLLVSIGTGTSYTFVDWNGSWATKDFGKVERFPLGNAVGGGFIKGVLELAGAGIKTEHIHSTLLDVILDIKIKDLDSSFAGTPMGELPVAYLGNAKHDSNKQDIMQAVTNCVATTIFRDILLMSMIPHEGDFPENIVFIGTPISKQGLLTNRLKLHFENWSKVNPNFKLKAFFPEKGEFSGAVGALSYGR